MRDYLDSILTFIGVETLTDEEFDSIELENIEDPLENYQALLSILESRGISVGLLSRLQYYFLAQGIAVSQSTPTPQSNIFLGASLDED